MMIVKRSIAYVPLMLLLNITLIIRLASPKAVAIVIGVGCAIFYLYYHIMPLRDRTAQRRRLRILQGGRELMLAATVCFTVEVLGYLYIFLRDVEMDGAILIVNALVGATLLLALLLNGMIRIFTCSSQLGIMPRIGLLLLWWVPLVNLILLKKFFSVSQAEYRFTLAQDRRNLERKHLGICQTTYPLLLVHGIFFRDWEQFNYWGRIPKALTDNGAVIYYGGHQSSASVEQCGEELRRSILDIVRESGCDKVNIIAHSKGGLDARYAISCLGMGQYAASLTTINTPHLGCDYVRKLLRIIPHQTVSAIGKKYASVFSKLGDDNPDFFNGLKDLTDQECARLNGLMPQAPGVYYQSVGSRLRSRASAIFPLKIGYGLIKLYGGGENDGLVATTSMEYGNFLGIVSPKGRQGISHGDMIDLTRKNIAGFDVCELYVDLVSRLKAKGL